MSGRKGMVHYALEVKREAVRLVEEEHLPHEEVAKRLAIRRAKRIERWVGMYRKEGEISFHKPKGSPRKVENEQSELKRLRMENALLKKFHYLGDSTCTVVRSCKPKTRTELSPKAIDRFFWFINGGLDGIRNSDA